MSTKPHRGGYEGLMGQESTNSASLAQAQRKIKQLETENKALAEELAEIKSSYIQMTRESTGEKYDERRVTFLKSQMIQLERQILLLNEALGGRMTVVVEAENSLATIIDRCRSYLDKEGRIGEVNVSKEDLKHIVSTAESARIKLYKNLENSSMQRLHKPLQFLETFIKSTHSQPPTLLDVCSANTMEHLNLKHVARLESKLCQVYKQLTTVHQCLDLHVYPESVKRQTDGRSNSHTGPQVPRVNYLKLYGEGSRACVLLDEVLPELLELSVLVPAAPLPVLKKCIVRELTVDNVMSKLPALSKSKAQDTREIVEALLKVLSLIQLKSSTQEAVYKEELKFHKSVYQLQLDYVDQLFQALRLGYQSFEDEANTVICKPLKEVLRIYEILHRTASEDALRHFLKVFKQHYTQMSDAVKSMECREKGDEAFSKFGDEFFEKLQKLESDFQSNRDSNIDKLEEVKEKQEEYWSEIKRMFHTDEVDLENSKNVQYSSRKSKHRNRSRTTPSLGTNSDNQHHIPNSGTNMDDQHHTPRSGTNTDIQPQANMYHFQYRKEPLPVIKNPESSRSNKIPSKQNDTDNRLCNDNDTTEVDLQKQSEDLFKATLRGGYDDNTAGFVFDLDESSRTGTPVKSPDISAVSGKTGSEISSSRTLTLADDSVCTCGAEEHSISDSNHSISSRSNHRKNRTFDAGDSNVHSKPPVNNSVSSKKSNVRLMKGVPRSKLLLKTKARSFDGNTSDASDQESSNQASPVRPLSRTGSLSRMEDKNGSDASGKRRSGSLPRNKPVSSPWR